MSIRVHITTVLALAAFAAALLLTGGISRAHAGTAQCETPVFQNGLELVFGRGKTRAAADKITAAANRVGFKDARTVQETCTVWKSVMRGIVSFDTAVAVQAEARRGNLRPTIECLKAQEIGQTQAVFGTRATLSELSDVIRRAGSFGYVGLKTKTAPCGGYQTYVAGFRDRAEALDYAREASQRTGLRVVIIKA
jgi:hypothetical protein